MVIEDLYQYFNFQKSGITEFVFQSMLANSNINMKVKGKRGRGCKEVNNY